MKPTLRSSEKRFKGRIFQVLRQEFEVDQGHMIVRDVVDKNDVVVCIVINEANEKIILTKEFRVGSMSIEYGLVAGIMEDDETAISAAIREVTEETGYASMSVEPLGSLYSSSGFTNEYVHYFIVKVRGDQGEQSLDTDERIELVEVYQGQFQDMIQRGEITGNHAVAAYGLAMIKGELDYLF